MGKVGECHKSLDEARKHYRDEANRDLHQWKGETDAEYEKRKARHKKRVRHLDKVTDTLHDKCHALEKRKDAKQDAKDGVVTFDGKQVAAWIAEWLKKSRKAGWNGTVTSGYRTPEYSESLCEAMCGAPSCPGKCAGRSSNHSGKDYPAGAVDVTDYYNFERIQFEIGSPLRNDLPYDPVHFSVSGH